MSVFTKSLKTFKSDITGEEREYKINLAIWAFFESEYGLTFNDLNSGDQSETVIAKFIHSVFHANGIETTLEDILENVASYDGLGFMQSFNMVNNENFTLVTDQLLQKAEEKKVQAKK